MSPGGRTGGKHWTKEEIEARQQADARVRRKSRATLKPPRWLKDEGLKVWKDIRKKLRGIELLDNVDSELLAIYCDAIVKYRNSTEMLDKKMVNNKGEEVFQEDEIKACQAWARIVSMYAEKLGLTPGGRARLAKKAAEPPKDDFGDKFGG